MSWQKVLLALTVAVCVSTPAFATILFSDDFEAGVSGEPLGAAVVGTWALSGSGAGAVPTNSLYLTVATTGGGLPASIYGDTYAGTIRGMPEVAAGAYDYADAPFTPQSNASTVVRFQAEIWGQNAGSTAADLNLAFMSDGTALNSVQISGTSTGGVVSVGGAATSLTWGIGEWHHVTMDYRPTDSTFSLAIDDQTPLTGLAMTASSAVDAVRFVQTSAGQDRWSVFDNVSISTIPEPSSIVLLVSALMGLVAYAWKIRR